MLKEKRSAALGFIFVTILIDVIGMGIIIPVIPKLIEGLTGGGLSDASRYSGWLLFSYAIMQFLFSPVLGGLSDRFGRRPILLISLFGLGIDYIFHAFAPSITWLFVGRLIAGLCGASFTTATAYIADISEPEKRAQNFGMVGVAFGVGFIIGPVIGGFCGGLWGPKAPFLVAAGMTLLNALYGYFMIPESLDAEHRRKFDWKRANPFGTLLALRRYKIVATLVTSLVFVYIAAHAVQSNWTFYTMLKFKWDEKMVGLSLGFVGILIAAVQGGLIRIIIPKIGQKNSVYYGLGLYAVGLLLFAFAANSLQMFAVLIPYCLGGIAGPALQGIVSSQVPANEQGELQGGLTSMMSATSIIGPLIMNNIFAHYTRTNAEIYFPGAPFILASFLCVISIVLAVRSLRRHEFDNLTGAQLPVVEEAIHG